MKVFRFLSGSSEHNPGRKFYQLPDSYLASQQTPNTNRKESPQQPLTAVLEEKVQNFTLDNLILQI